MLTRTRELEIFGRRAFSATRSFASSREVLRTYPIAPFTFFGTATRDFEVDGYGVREGWKGIGAIWPTLQDPATFDDPTAFRGDRLDDATFGSLRHVPTYPWVPARTDARARA